MPRVEMRHTHETERTDFGCERGRSTDLTTGRAEVDDFYFGGVLRAAQRGMLYQHERKRGGNNADLTYDFWGH